MPTEPKIVGAEWAAQYPVKFGAARAPASSAVRLPCLVCGHPTGDCSPDDHEEALMPTKDKPAAAARDSSTGVPTPAPTADPPPDDAGQGVANDVGITDSVGSTDSVGVTDNPAGTPIAPDGTVRPEMYDPVGVGGAKNDHDELAGGMHADSEALDADTSEVTDERIRSRAFTSVGDGLVASTRTVYVEFIPDKTKRVSRILMFPKGQTYSRAEVAHRVGMYADRAEAKLVYTDE